MPLIPPLQYPPLIEGNQQQRRARADQILEVLRQDLLNRKTETTRLKRVARALRQLSSGEIMQLLTELLHLLRAAERFEAIGNVTTRALELWVLQRETAATTQMLYSTAVELFQTKRVALFYIQCKLNEIRNCMTQ